MNFSAGQPATPPHEVLRWIYERSNAPKAFSISICSHHSLPSKDFGDQLASYLNEFDPDGFGAWRSFDVDFIQQTASDPNLHRAIKDATLSLTSFSSDSSDFEQTSAGIGALGHAILIGEASLLANKLNPKVFKVCLDSQEHGPGEKHLCDLWLNAPRFNPRSQVTSIGDAFLDWQSRI